MTSIDCIQTLQRALTDVGANVAGATPTLAGDQVSQLFQEVLQDVLGRPLCAVELIGADEARDIVAGAHGLHITDFSKELHYRYGFQLQTRLDSVESGAYRELKKWCGYLDPISLFAKSDAEAGVRTALDSLRAIALYYVGFTKSGETALAAKFFKLVRLLPYGLPFAKRGVDGWLVVRFFA